MADNDIRFSRIPKDAAERWEVVRDVIAGDQALRKDKYLPYLNRADTSPANVERNIAYKERAVLYTATGFTLAGMIGLAFRHDPKHALPTQLEYLLKDCDGSGVSIYQQSQAALARVVGPGRHGLYTDFSSTLKRPIIKPYFAEDIINWRESLVGGKAVRTLVVLREDAEKDDGYAVECVDQWRELFLNEQGFATCRIWQLDENKVPAIVPMQDAEGKMVDEVVLRSSGSPLDAIPFEFIGSQNNDSSIDESPLYGIAKVNVAHFRNSADYEDSAFLHGQSQFWMSGLDVEWRDWFEKNGVYIGARKPILLPLNGACGFAQAQPNTLAKEAMDQKEAQMVALGARLIDKTSAVKTATQSEGEREASTSILALCVSNTSEAYQNAIRSCARYLDIELPEDEDLYEINQDFTTVSSDPLTITALVGAWQSGLMAKADVRAYFRRQGTIDPERSNEDIDADIKVEGHAPMPGATPGGPAAPGATPADGSNAAPDAAPAADFGPLIASIGTLVDALGKPTPPVEPPAPPDFGALIAAMPQPADLSGVVEAMREQADAIRTMAPPVVNFQAGDVNVAPAQVTVEPAQVTIAEGAVRVEAPITVQPAQVIQQRTTGVDFTLDADGNPTGAKFN